MWVSPHHPRHAELTAPRPPAATPPEPSGRLLATFPRPGRGRGPDAELRLVVDEYQGHEYLSLRLWQRGPNDAWFPTKKGVSVRLSEADDLAAVLTEAARQAFAPPARVERR